jgi:hypothetical protein
MDFSETLAQARDILGAEVQFGDVQQLDSQHTVLRVAITQGVDLPASVIIKQLPEDARFGAYRRVMSEWAGLEFANMIASDIPFAPRFLAGDTASLMVILEDLGDVQSLDTVLHQEDRTVARQALIDYGTFLGTLHRAGKGRDAEFKAIQTRLDVTAPPNDSSLDLRGMLDRFRESFAPMTANLDALEAEAVSASAAMHDANSFRTFQHHDAGPHNILVTPAGLRFVDYEFAQYDNALLDMTAVRLAFPPFGKGYLLPQDVVLAYEQAYRVAVFSAIPAVMDEQIYQLTLEQACAKWLLTKVLGRLFYPVLVCNELDKLSNPDAAAQIPESRNMVYTWLVAYVQWYGDKAQLPYTRDVMQRIVNDMKRYNPEVEAARLYGAFVTNVNSG